MPLGFLGGALISGAASLIGGKQQADAASDAAAAQERQYQQTREDLEPYRGAGEQGLEAYLGELGFDESGYNAPDAPDFSFNSLAEGFQESPGYEYARDQGLKAIQNSASARGNLHSGGTQLELMRHANGLANQDFYNYVGHERQGRQDNYNVRQSRLSRLESLAGMGAQAATQTGQFGANAASNAGNIRLQGAGAAAGGLAGAANAANGYINNTANYDLMRRAAGISPSQPSGIFGGA